MGFLSGSDSKESACNAGDPGLILESERYPGEGKGYHSSLLAWRIPWTEEPAGYNPWGCKQSDMPERLTLSIFHFKPS